MLYPVIAPLLPLKVKYDSSVGLAEHVIIHDVAYTILDHSLSQLKATAFTLYQYVCQFVKLVWRYPVPVIPVISVYAPLSIFHARV
jgi:hypothetical protein